MKILTLLTGASLLLLFGSTAARAAETRFSATLTPEERVATGVDRLSSDQVGALDALIRRESVPRAKSRASGPARFSERIPAEERHAAGLDSLSAVELARLDKRFERTLSPPVGSLATTESFSSPRTFLPESRARSPEIHGSFSAWYGTGSGGCSERGAGMTVGYFDPFRRFSAVVSYSVSKVNGTAHYRDFPPEYLQSNRPLVIP